MFNINAKEENVINPKARINGKVVDKNTRLSINRELTQKETKNRIENYLKVLSEIEKRETKKAFKYSVLAKEKTYTIKINNSSFELDIGVYSKLVNAKIKKEVSNILQ